MQMLVFIFLISLKFFCFASFIKNGLYAAILQILLLYRPTKVICVFLQIYYVYRFKIYTCFQFVCDSNMMGSIRLCTMCDT